MSRIHIPSIETASGPTAEVYAEVRKVTGGSVPNLFAVLGALAPESLKAILHAEGVLASSTLSKQDIETIKVLVSDLTDCGYCLAAHVMLGKMTGLSSETLKQIRSGVPTGVAQRDALAHFVRTLVQTNGTISKDEFDAIKGAGYTDNQLVDITLAIALTIFTNTFNRINDTDVDFPPAD